MVLLVMMQDLESLESTTVLGQERSIFGCEWNTKIADVNAPSPFWQPFLLIKKYSMLFLAIIVSNICHFTSSPFFTRQKPECTSRKVYKHEAAANLKSPANTQWVQCLWKPHHVPWVAWHICIVGMNAIHWLRGDEKILLAIPALSNKAHLMSSNPRVWIMHLKCCRLVANLSTTLVGLHSLQFVTVFRYK